MTVPRTEQYRTKNLVDTPATGQHWYYYSTAVPHVPVVVTGLKFTIDRAAGVLRSKLAEFRSTKFSTEGRHSKRSYPVLPEVNDIVLYR